VEEGEGQGGARVSFVPGRNEREGEGRTWMAGSMLSLQAKAQGQRAVPRRGSRCEEKKGTDLSVLHKTERPFHIMRAVESTMAKLRAWVRTWCGTRVRVVRADDGEGRRG